MNESINFEKLISNNDIPYCLYKYLKYYDMININLLNKKIYKLLIYRYKIYITLTLNPNVNMINKIFLKNINYIKFIKSNEFCILYTEMKCTNKTKALYYYYFYPKDCVNEYFIFTSGYKLELINRYRTGYKIENNTRYDLYKLVYKIPFMDLFYIGW